MNSGTEYINWIEEAISKRCIQYYEFEHFRDLQAVGTSDIGNIYRANWKNWKQPYWLKSLSNLNDDISVKELVHEIKLHRKVDFHENIINFYGITASSQEYRSKIKKYLLVTDYADGGSFESYLRENFKRLSWNNKYELAIQLSSAVSYLHHEGIVHRNLHSGSVLIHQEKIKIADFGLSKRIKEVSSQNIVGVIPYIDPKRFGSKLTHPFDEKKSDVYSVGVLLWEISSGKPPFCVEVESYNVLAVKILQGKRENIFPDTPTEYVSIYTECWDTEPDNRPSIHDVVVKLKSGFSQVEKSEKKKLISKIIEFISVIANTGKGNGKEILVNYFNNNNIDFPNLYNWLLNNQPDPNSIFLLGYFWYFGIQSEVCYEKAFNLFSIASEQNHILALYYVGICYQNGHGVTKDEGLALDYFKILANNDHAMGQFKLGYLFNKDKNFQMALYWYEKAAKNGHIVATYNLGRKYYKSEKYEKAKELFEKSASEGYMDGITRLGCMYEEGIGTDPDYQKAIELYQMAADLGSKIAQCNLAFMCENELSAAQGDQDAQEMQIDG